MKIREDRKWPQKGLINTGKSLRLATTRAGRLPRGTARTGRGPDEE